mmetsp:Transcript_12883/g.20979  ORF Transcript_12883/g.20979 Transcript_12883/m.20979 type:complete len:457 (+) Transcript_12883:1-1371(+)
MTPAELRLLLTKFVEYHPEAEKQVARLILKHLGINKSTFWGSSAIDIASASSGDDDNESVLSSPLPLQRGDDTDILPNLSPVPWLSEESWSSMSYNEKIGFMEHITNGTFHSEHLLPFIHGRYYPTSHPFRIQSDEMRFGKEGVDRIVLGHGPRRVLILVGIHGNEPCGVEAVKMLLQRKTLFSGHANVSAKELLIDENWNQPIDALFESLTIEFLLGNPAALEKNTRFLKKNLNRLFDTHLLCDDESAEEEGYKYELQRARLIAESIRDAAFVLDVHSCSADVGSFALPSSMDLSEELAESLPVKYVIESLVHATVDGGTTLDCALLHDVPGVCVECGQHSHPNIDARAVSIISSFLSMQVLTDEGSFAIPKLELSEKPTVMRCEYAERVGLGFEWLNQFPEFHFVAENTPIFRDDSRGDVQCPIPGGAYIVMATASPVIGEEALFWASAKNRLV